MEHDEKRGWAHRQVTYGLVDRSGWPSGPWDEEPDLVAWADSKTGLVCEVNRCHADGGSLRGLVRVPKSKHSRDLDWIRFEVHGPVHIVAAPEGGMIVEFRCNRQTLDDLTPLTWSEGNQGEYRDLQYVRSWMAALASQVVERKPKIPEVPEPAANDGRIWVLARGQSKPYCSFMSPHGQPVDSWITAAFFASLAAALKVADRVPASGTHAWVPVHLDSVGRELVASTLMKGTVWEHLCGLKVDADARDTKVLMASMLLSMQTAEDPSDLISAAVGWAAKVGVTIPGELQYCDDDERNTAALVAQGAVDVDEWGKR